jgi:hypothetical protein
VKLLPLSLDETRTLLERFEDNIDPVTSLPAVQVLLDAPSTSLFQKPPFLENGRKVMEALDALGFRAFVIPVHDDPDGWEEEVSTVIPMGPIFVRLTHKGTFHETPVRLHVLWTPACGEHPGLDSKVFVDTVFGIFADHPLPLFLDLLHQALHGAPLEDPIMDTAAGTRARAVLMGSVLPEASNPGTPPKIRL